MAVSKSITGFLVDVPDEAGERANRPITLHPAPTRVEYPGQDLGTQIETADGRVVLQIPNYDSRKYGWVWANYRSDLVVYERQYRSLDNLRSRVRYGRGLPAHVYVYDGTSRGLDKTHALRITPTSVVGTVITFPDITDIVHPDDILKGTVEVLHNASGGSAAPYERRTVSLSSATTITMNEVLSAAIGTSDILLTWKQPVWYKVRVLDTTRILKNDGGSVRFDESRFSFVIDEALAFEDAVVSEGFTIVTTSPWSF